MSRKLGLGGKLGNWKKEEVCSKVKNLRNKDQIESLMVRKGIQ